MYRVSSEDVQIIIRLRDELTELATDLEQIFASTKKNGMSDPEEIIPLISNMITCANDLKEKIKEIDYPDKNLYNAAVNLWSGSLALFRYYESDKYEQFFVSLEKKFQPHLNGYLRMQRRR